MLRAAVMPKIYFAGDTGLFGDMKMIAEIYKPAIAFLPIGDHFTMDPVQAAWACELLRVRRVVPIHWGTFPLLQGSPEALGRELAARGLDTEVVALEPGESWSPRS